MTVIVDEPNAGTACNNHWRVELLDEPVQVALSWQVDADVRCRIERRYSPYGLLEPLAAD